MRPPECTCNSPITFKLVGCPIHGTIGKKEYERLEESNEIEFFSLSSAGLEGRILEYIRMRKQQTEEYIGVEVLAGNEVKRLIEVAVLAELEALERFIEKAA